MSPAERLKKTFDKTYSTNDSDEAIPERSGALSNLDFVVAVVDVVACRYCRLSLPSIVPGCVKDVDVFCVAYTLQVFRS